MRRLELAERIIELRERADVTQEEAAKRAGVGVTTWSNIETGTITRPHARTLIKMARVLGVDPEELTHPKAPAPLPLEDAGRPSVFAEAIAAVAEKWLQIGPPASPTDYGKLLGIIDAALDLEDLMGTRLGEPEWWAGLSAQEKHDFVRVDKLLTEVAERHLARLEEGIQREEAPIDLEEFRRRKDAVAQRNRRWTATA